jgi:Putative zinc-finger
MEHAPLRPVPARPAGPIDSDTALREVEAWLPTLPVAAAHALAMVVLAERPRAEVAGTLDVSEADVARMLATARKELRQTIVILGGSGWCERAEGLISDRLDGTLADRDVSRLDVHLRNCGRCVEHERRLVQATDALIAGAGGRSRSPAPATEPPPLAEATSADERGEAGDAEASSEAAEAASTPPGEVSEPAAPPPPDATGEEATGAAPPPTDDRGEQGAAAGEPSFELEPAERAVEREQIAAAAEVLVAARTRRQIAVAVVWNALIAIAILLTLATIVLTVAGVLGAEL